MDVIYSCSLLLPVALGYTLSSSCPSFNYVVSSSWCVRRFSYLFCSGPFLFNSSPLLLGLPAQILSFIIAEPATMIFSGMMHFLGPSDLALPWLRSLLAGMLGLPGAGA